MHIFIISAWNPGVQYDVPMPNLFDTYNAPPVFLTFYQDQKRVLGVDRFRLGQDQATLFKSLFSWLVDLLHVKYKIK